jgi:hypothetical protein
MFLTNALAFLALYAAARALFVQVFTACSIGGGSSGFDSSKQPPLYIHTLPVGKPSTIGKKTFSEQTIFLRSIRPIPSIIQFLNRQH